MTDAFVMAFDLAPASDKSVLQQRIQELVDRHGGVRAAARVLEVDQGYVYRLLSGEKNDPGEKLLRKLKLRRVVTFERTDLPPPAKFDNGPQCAKTAGECTCGLDGGNPDLCEHYLRAQARRQSEKGNHSNAERLWDAAKDAEQVRERRGVPPSGAPH